MGKRQKTLAFEKDKEGLPDEVNLAQMKEERRFPLKQVYENPYREFLSEDSLESDEEGEINRIGSVPLWWYDNHGHLGTRSGLRMS